MAIANVVLRGYGNGTIAGVISYVTLRGYDIASPPVADFSGTPLTGTSPQAVVFTDLSTNTPTAWLWEKSSDGGGTWNAFSGTPTVQNPTESFTAGTWSVRLTVSNTGGFDVKTRIGYITISGSGGGGNGTRLPLMGAGKR